MHTVLVVDDQPTVRATIGYVLSAHDYNVILAASGAEALAINVPFDVALIDLYMPGGDGFAVCRSLRERMAKEGRNAAVVMMTAAFTHEAADKAIADGATGMLKKPFTAAEMIAELERAIANPAPAAAVAAPAVAAA
jgi:CheY-like chemotaxis protein